MLILQRRCPLSLKDIKNNERTTKSISIKSRGSNINLHPLIIKLLDAEKTVVKKEYGFDETFNIFMKQIISAIKFIGIILGLLTRLKKKCNPGVFEDYRR